VKSGTVERSAARVVLLDPLGRVLLQEIKGTDVGGSVWITPGGGLALGDTHREAALRELREEVGHTPAELGPCVWIREHEFDFRGTRYRQRERFFLARTERFPIDSSQMDEIEREIVLSHRWWTVDEIEAATRTTFAPRLLGRYLRPLINGAIPEEPIDVGV
jgi:8-oxo-dGTP pyrophosphatase MutT (NUDIX family)